MPSHLPSLRELLHHRILQRLIPTVENMSSSSLYDTFARALLSCTALGVLLLALTGCGNKGPLYLPSSPEPREAASAEQAPAVEPTATPDNQ